MVAGPGNKKCGSWREDSISDQFQDKAANTMKWGGKESEEALTVISAYGRSGNAARRVCSSSAAARATASWDPRRNDSCWQPAGMPVMGSRRAFSWAMDHDGEIRRSEEEFGE